MNNVNILIMLPIIISYRLKKCQILALHREDIDKLKEIFVCVKQYRGDDVEYTH